MKQNEREMRNARAQCTNARATKQERKRPSQLRPYGRTAVWRYGRRRLDVLFQGAGDILVGASVASHACPDTSKTYRFPGESEHRYSCISTKLSLHPGRHHASNSYEYMSAIHVHVLDWQRLSNNYESGVLKDPHKRTYRLVDIARR